MQARIALAVGLAMLVLPLGAYAADACKHRGELDAMYCDDNNDMVADSPTDPKKWKNPSTIVFTYTPVEDPAVYENIFKPFTTYLAKCVDKKVVFYQVQSNAAEIEAMRSGRLHVAGFSTGPTAFAVNLAGAVPFAVKGTAKEFQSRRQALGLNQTDLARVLGVHRLTVHKYEHGLLDVPQMVALVMRLAAKQRGFDV